MNYDYIEKIEIVGSGSLNEMEFLSREIYGNRDKNVKAYQEYAKTFKQDNFVKFRRAAQSMSPTFFSNSSLEQYKNKFWEYDLDVLKLLPGWNPPPADDWTDLIVSEETE